MRSNLLRPDSLAFAGIDNYLFVVSADPVFWSALVNTLILTVGSVILALIVGLVYAELVNHRYPGRGIVRTMFITPFLVMPRVYRATPLHPPLHRRIGSIPVNLERPDPGAIKRVLRALDAGRIVGIFPEGPFSQEGRLVTGQPGAALIALRAGVPIVPAAIQGTYEALRARRFYVPRRRPLSVRFGAPLVFDRPRHRTIARAEREDVTRRIMSEIAGLLHPASEPAAAAGRAGAS